MMTTALLVALVLGQTVTPVKVIDPSQPSAAVTTSTAPGNKRGLDVNVLAAPASASPSAVVNAGNSTTQVLGPGGVFLGAAVDTLPYAAISYTIQSDVISAVGGIQREWSQDNVNWFTWTGDDLRSTRVGPDKGTDLMFRTHARYFRLRYTNGGTQQGFFRVQTVLHPTIPAGDTMGVDHAPISGDDAILTKSVMTGKTTAGGGSYVDVKVNPSGALTVESTISGTVSVAGGLPVVTATGTLDQDNDVVTIALSGHTAVSAAVSDATACSLGAEFLRADGSWSSAALYDARNWSSIPGDFSGGDTRALMVIPPGATQARVICNGAGAGVAPYGVTVSLTATGASGPAPYVQTGGTPASTVNPNVHVTVGGIDVGSTPQVLQMDAGGRLRTLATPSPKIATSPVAAAISVTDSATALPAAPLADRMSLCIYNNSSATVFVGDAAVTTASGFPVPAGGSFCDDAGAQPYYGIVASGTAEVRVLEN